MSGDALALHEESGRAPGPLGDTRDVLARLARALVNASRGVEAAAIYFELARKAEAAGEGNLELRWRGAEQLLRSGHWDEGRRAFAEVLDELDLRPPATRVGALWRLLWRRAWVRLRGFESRIRTASGELDWRRRNAMPFMRMPYLRARALSVHGLAALAAGRSGERGRRLVRVATRDARQSARDAHAVDRCARANPRRRRLVRGR